MSQQDLTTLETYALLAILVAPIVGIFPYLRWLNRRRTRTIEGRMAAFYAEEVEWANAVRRRDHASVPPVVLRTYETATEYVQDLAQMKALRFEVQDQVVYDDGRREVTFYFAPAYERESSRGR